MDYTFVQLAMAIADIDRCSVLHRDIKDVKVMLTTSCM